MKTIGPAKMLKTDVVKWLSDSGFNRLSEKVNLHYLPGILIPCTELVSYMSREDVRGGIIFRQMETGVSQYCEIVNQDK